MPIKPKALKPGDTLAVVSPASPIDPERLKAGNAIFESAGYQIKLFPHTLDAEFYLAGSDEARAHDLQSAFDDPDVQAVVCSRGGYGCARLFPYLDIDQMVDSGKMLIGFSDITTLHIAWQRRGAISIHAPMPLTLSYERESWVLESLFRTLRGDGTIPNEAPSAETVVPGAAEGELVGGCLCLICDSLGTPEEIITANKILVIEDVDENPHRVDAMLTHLLNAGKLHEAAGVVVGEMTRTDDIADRTIGAKPWRNIVAERLERAGVPAVLNFPFGHMKTMLTLALGARAHLNADEGTLKLLESPCES